MLGNNFEKMALISSTRTNEWPQNNQNLMASTTNMAMEKQTQQQPQPQQQPALKCPRCDSSNTKFCYYNNYSLSQPRHFCKACKRYWTRGGTLRNVPVGGGCRKNKRVKKPSSATTAIDSSPSSSSAPLVTTNPSGHSQMDHINPLFYGLHSNLSFPRFNNNSRVHDNSAQVYEYDLDQPQVNGLGFSSSGLMTSAHDVTSKSLLLNHPLAPIFGSLNSSTISASASDSPNLNMASLIASNLQQHQKFIPGGGSRDNTRGSNNFHGFSPYEDHMQMQGNINLMEQIGAISSDPNSLFWNATGVGANWFDPTNIGSSVPSLI